MRVRYSTKHTINHRKFLTFLVILALLVLSLHILPVYALGSVVDNYTTLSGYSVVITGYWNQLGYTNAWVILTVPNASGIAQSLTLKLMKTGSPAGYYQFDLYDSSMVLQDWSAAQSIAALSGVRKTNKNLAYTQGYTIVNGTTYYVGIRAINATLLDSNNYIAIDYDECASETLKDHTGVNWYTDSYRGIYFIFYVTVSSKSWHRVSTWTASLVTRTWASGTSFSLSLLIGQYINIGSWTLNLITESWKVIWIWTFDLIPPMWYSISWDFVLTYPVSLPILFVGFAFVFLLAIGIVLYYYWEK